ncbi:BT_3987 domain-containing protein [Bacteroides finegoldii]|uniref:BT_3987 domain-containing protein n=1 Tax=Bacteroides finegoldii TaxID=338188 RepID=UPI00189F9AF1|nr:DUF1735 domain-containing protein [Bacteroides finegoldii]
MMKYIYNKYWIALISLSCLLLTSCDYADGEGEASANAVYMETPDNKGVLPFVLEPEGGTIAITPRLANITGQEVTIKVEYDKSVLDTYNKKNATSYVALPASAFKLSDGGQKEMTGSIDIKVAKGDFATQAFVKVGKLDEEQFPNTEKYAIPLLITSASAYTLIPSQRTVLLLLNRPLVTSVALVSGYFRYKPANVWTQPEWTIQMSAMYSSLSRSNLTTAFISNWAGSEFYTRINSNQGIQVKNGRDGDDTWTQVSLQPHKWLHISYVHKDRTVTVYVNGKVHKVFPTGAIWMTEDSWIQVGNDGYKNDYLRELRFWSKALTEAEINDMLYTPVSPDTPDLRAYLPLTKEAGTKDLVAPEGATPVEFTGKIEYVENVKFPSDDLVIVEK